MTSSPCALGYGSPPGPSGIHSKTSGGCLQPQVVLNPGCTPFLLRRACTSWLLFCVCGLPAPLLLRFGPLISKVMVTGTQYCNISTTDLLTEMVTKGPAKVNSYFHFLGVLVSVVLSTLFTIRTVSEDEGENFRGCASMVQMLRIELKVCSVKV